MIFNEMGPHQFLFLTLTVKSHLSEPTFNLSVISFPPYLSFLFSVLDTTSVLLALEYIEMNK